MNSGRNALRLLQAVRRYSSKAAADVKELPSNTFGKLKDTQLKYQCDDGIPVYIKTGFKDKFLYQVTLVLLLGGLVMAGDTLFRLSVPKKD